MRVSHPDGTEHICFLNRLFIEISPEPDTAPIKTGPYFRLRIAQKGGLGYEHTEYANGSQLEELAAAIKKLLGRNE